MGIEAEHERMPDADTLLDRYPLPAYLRENVRVGLVELLASTREETELNANGLTAHCIISTTICGGSRRYPTTANGIRRSPKPKSDSRCLFSACHDAGRACSTR